MIIGYLSWVFQENKSIIRDVRVLSPLLKKLLAKEDTNNKPNSSNAKDPINVALFYD